MKAFTVDAENEITVLASLRETELRGREAENFGSHEELGTLAERWPGARLVEIWNVLPGVKPVQKFTSRAVAVRRIWAAVQQLKPKRGPLTGTVASADTASKTPAAIAAPGANAKNKAVLVITLLKVPKGATLQNLMRATGWQAHTVRGFVSGHLKKKLGLKVQSFKRDGERVYAIKG